MERKNIVIGLGRFNPPTIGHDRLIDAIRQESIGQDHLVFMSQRYDKNNPLTPTSRLKHMARAYPDILVSVIPQYQGIFDCLDYVVKKNYTDVVMIAGSDMAGHYKQLFEYYTMIPRFHSLIVKSCGLRSDDSYNTSQNASSMLMRKLAMENNFQAFKKYAPFEIAENNQWVEDLFRETRSYGQRR